MKLFRHAYKGSPHCRLNRWLALMFLLSGCALGPIYQAPPELTSQTGASITGITDPMSNLISTGIHICLNAIDGTLPRYPYGGNCDKPILLTPGAHALEVSADFHPFPAEFGMATLNVNLDAGKAYFIRATGGPVAFMNTDGHLSVPTDMLVTVWIESDAGVPVTEKLPIPLQTPQSIPIIIPVPSK